MTILPCLLRRVLQIQHCLLLRQLFLSLAFMPLQPIFLLLIELLLELSLHYHLL